MSLLEESTFRDLASRPFSAPELPFVSVTEAMAELRAGRMIVVVDDEDRENEGDLTLAAEYATPEAINFMARYGRGLICLALTEQRADHLRLGPMTRHNSCRFGTAFTESIEAREGVTTGISAYDRARTIQVAIGSSTTAHDLARPGHIFPLRARKGGVLVRAGQTEASVDLARLAGCVPAGVICEIMNDDGSMARVPELIRFCNEHRMKMLTVAELIRYRLQNERYVAKMAEGVIGTPYGEFRMVAYESEIDGANHIALMRGDTDGTFAGNEPVMVRVQTHCLAGNVFGSSHCYCRAELQRSLAAIASSGRGVVLYLNNTGRGFAVESVVPQKVAIAHVESGACTRHDGHRRILRQVGIGSQILADLGIRKVRLLSNRPTHVPALQGFEIEIVDQIPIPESSVASWF